MESESKKRFKEFRKYLNAERYCSCPKFVMIMRDVDTGVPFCSECKKEVKV